MPLESIGNPYLWGGFILFVLAMLAIDLGIFNRKAHTIGFREALTWSVVWIALALAFNAGVWWFFGSERGIEFLSGYLIEKALSVDNIFVFLVIFSTLQIPSKYQHRVLFWGILSALIMRAIMIFAGAALLEKFHWLIYVFGAFLIATGIKLFLHHNNGSPDQAGPVLRFLKRIIPNTDKFDGQFFFTKINGKWLATPLFLALLLVEITDVVFAIDSIPAIFAITRDPFIVFTSNIFAILGLRSLYFVLGGLVERFAYLKVGLAAVLVFVGAKMAAIDFIKIPPAYSLLVIASLLGISIGYSWFSTRKQPQT